MSTYSSARSGRANAAAVLTGVPPQVGPHGGRARAAAVIKNEATQHLGKPRTIPQQVLGAKNLVGQLLHTADGRAFRVTRVDVVLPDTAETYAALKRYGTAQPDATAVARCPPPLRPAARPLPWEQPAAPLTTFMRPSGTPAPTLVGPTQPPKPPTPVEQYVGQPLDVGGKHYGGATSILEANALTHASKTKINNALFQSVQKFNRMAGAKVLAPSRVASNGVGLLRATQGAANFSSKYGSKLGYVGMGLSAAKIWYEVSNDKWNAHTAVDGTMLVVTAAGVVATVLAGGTAPVWVPIAGAVILVHGILDYAFDLGGQLDQHVGRQSDLRPYWLHLQTGQ